VKILALDLSTKTGWALLIDGKLFEAGRINLPDVPEDSRAPYPMHLIERSKRIAQTIAGLINTFQPNTIVIEETNQPGFGRSRDAQKQLEFIHYSVADTLWQMGKLAAYVSTSRWQKFAGVKLSADERKSNKSLAEKRDQAKADLKEQIASEVVAKYADRLNDCRDRKAKQAVRKEMAHEVKSRLKKAIRSIRIKEGGEVVGKKTLKHRSVEVCNRELRTNLKSGDHDIANAALLALGYYRSLERPA